MPVFKHGKNAKVALGDLNSTAYLNEASLSSTSETAQTSVFGDGVTKYVLGLRDGTVSLSGFFEGSTGAIDEELSSYLGVDDSANFMVLPAGDSAGAGSRTWFGKGDLTSYETSSPVSDVVSISAEIQADSGVNSGIYLRNVGGSATFETTGAGATDNGTSVNNTTSTTDGGVGQVHVMNNSLDGTVDVKIQDSADDTSWADLITFTQVASGNNASEQVTVTGTVDQYVRSQVTTGGTTGTAEIAVAFKRN